MESSNNTPNQIKKEDENEKLKVQLEKMLEEELEKSPCNINTKKIDSITILLEQMDGIKEDGYFDKDEFAERYLCEYIKPQKNKAYNLSFKRMRMASVIFIFIVIFALGNYVSVKATNKGIVTLVRERADIFYFDVLKKDTEESAAYDNFSDIQRKNELSGNTYESWEKIKSDVEYDFRIPYFIPKGFEGNDISFQEMGEVGFMISRSYYFEDKYIRFYIRAFITEGMTSSLIQDVDTIVYEKTVGDKYVTCYQVEENIQAFFQEENFIYEIITNLSENDIEQIILEMRY